MDKKVLVIILVISVAINAATLFTFGYFCWTRRADPGRQELIHRPPMTHDWQHTRIAKDLDLNKQQIEDIRGINEEIRNTMLPMREELFKKRQELMSLFNDKEPDMEHADLLLKEIAELQVQHDEQIFYRLVKIRDVLTPEQQEQLGGLLHEFIEQGRPPEPPHMPVRHHKPFELPRGEGGR